MILLLFCLSVFAQTGTGNIAELPDSLRISVRLKSHLLILPEQLAPGQLDSLFQENIPMAFLFSGSSNDELDRLLAKIPAKNLPVMIISDDESLNQSKFPSGTFFLNSRNLDKFRTSENQELQLKQLTCNELLWMIADADSFPTADYFVSFWERTGKLPNFIQVDAQYIRKAAGIVSNLNSQTKIFGVTRNGNELLADVSWKDFPHRRTNGHFSFPTSSLNSLALAPYKAGYQFSPDIVLPSPENLRNMKVFNVVPLSPEFGLMDHYIFSKKVHNLQRKNDTEIINYGIDFKDDESRENCAYFSGNAYADCGLMSRSALKPNFSITAWIKPVKLGENNCIVGKGKDFVLKIHNGLLTFTVQGIKDYHSEKTKIPVNQWTFIALVHSVAENQVSFYMNGERTETISLLTPYAQSDYTMLIGSNLWEEFFTGYIHEIKIWDRELNEEQVRNEFLSSKEDQNPVSAGYIIGTIILLGVLGYILFIQIRRKRTSEAVVKHIPVALPNQKLSIHDAPEKINCFGGLKVFNSEGKDISLKFSPKIKQLFVLILLHSGLLEKGISSKKLSDYLWPGMSVPKAKNIRGTNIQNLKALLASCSEMKLVFQDKFWKFEFADGYFVDLFYVEAKLNESLTSDTENIKKELPELLLILKKGTLFPNMSESWVDPYVDRMSDRIIEFGLKIFRLLPEEKFESILLDMAEVISINDPLNEPALRKKISILIRQGKLSLAHSVFDNFVKLYFELYKEKYPNDFRSLVDKEHEF
ncbi:MAG: LamG-like jellyroll fold domain-containing protein [Bacteroidota bacterium]|nr:LamG-like jellyroll fold domain-containing protein [Bacteroidota bacterium]